MTKTLSTHDNSPSSFLQPSRPPQPIEERSYDNVPSSQPANLTFKTLGAGADGLGDMPSRASRGIEIVVEEREHERRITQKSKNSETVLYLKDIRQLQGCNKSIKKIWHMLLVMLSEQALRNREFIQDYIRFPLEELVTRGSFANTSNARRAIKQAMNFILSLQIEHTIHQKYGDDKTSAGSIFYHYKIEENQCYAYINTKHDPAVLFQFFTRIPSYALALASNKAFDLIWHIYYMARQRTDYIKKSGFFLLKLRSILNALNLPDERQKNIKDIKNKIFNVIDNSISDIIKTQKQKTGNSELQLLIEYKGISCKSISEVLDTIKRSGNKKPSNTEIIDGASLKVVLTGSQYNFFSNINDSKSVKTKKPIRQKLLMKP